MMLWIWICLAVALGIGEMLTAGFFLLPFAIGGVVSALTALFNGPLWLQIVLFVCVSAVCLFFLRPFAKKVTGKEPQKSGINRLMGVKGTVLLEIPAGGTGRVLVSREEWNATAEDENATFAQGATIEVVTVEGAHVVVKAAEE